MSVLALLMQRFAMRHWRQAPGASALLVLILALGVAVYFAIRLANRAAVASFQHFTELVAAPSDWVLQAPAGDLPETILAELRRELGTEPVNIVPVVETTATRPPRGQNQRIGARETIRVLGLDLIGLQNLAAHGTGGSGWFEEKKAGEGKVGDRFEAGDEGGFWRAWRNPRGVFIGRALAESDGLKPGSVLTLVVNETQVDFEVAGIVPETPDRPAMPASLLVMDLAAGQRWTGREGWLTRVELVVEEGLDAAARRASLGRLLERLGRGSAISAGPGGDAARRWWVSSPADRKEAGAAMTRAFRLNLTILSLIALLVGLYLVFQALDGAVVRRRFEIGVLRSLGVEEGTIRNAWLVEAAVLGVAGGALGVSLGWAGAQVSVRLVGQTVNALYHATSAQSAALGGAEWIEAIGLGVGASLLAGWLPARNAARTPPAQLLVRHGEAARGSWILRHPLVAAGLVVSGMGLALLPPWRFDGGTRFPLGGYAAALAWIAGGGMLGGWLLARMAWAARPLGTQSAVVRLALSQVRRPSGRHLLATAGLVCAVAMTAGMVILVGSFERTMRGWIERSFQSDLYLSSTGAQSASTDNRISPATWLALVAHPAVADANVMHACEVRLPAGATILVGSDLGFAERHLPPAWIDPPPAGWWRVTEPATTRAEAFVSESFRERFRLGRGDDVELPTADGGVRLRIAGVFADYGNERGSLVVDRRAFTNWFRSALASSVILKLKDPGGAEAVRAELLGDHPGLQIFTNGHLRLEVLRIFRQTFAITYALEAIGIVVAVLGLAMTLASVLMERRPEWTTLRALGMSHRELAWTAAGEGLLVGFAGLIAGLATSLVLGWLLIRVINKQTFGWTLQWALPWGELVALSLLVLVSAGATSLMVGRWGARLPAEREE